MKYIMTIVPCILLAASIALNIHFKRTNTRLRFKMNILQTQVNYLTAR